MTSTQDNVNFDNAMSNDSSEFAEKPFLQKELNYVIDNNGSNDYSRNQIVFETISISNNGKWADYKNGFISIPMVATLSRTDEHLDAAEGFNALKFKSSNLIHIDSMAIDYGNDGVIQQHRNFNAYCVFKQHTTMSENDVTINGPTIGYRKDSEVWNYDNVTGVSNYTDELVVPVSRHNAQQELVLSNDNIKKSGVNYYEFDATNNVHVYYYDCIIRLKDLLFFDKMPPVRGANIKITLTLNQAETVVTIQNGIKTSIVNNLKGLTNPLLRTFESYTGTADLVETISLKVAKNGAYSHVKQQCRLYVPTYIMSPTFEKQYEALGQKKIIYEDVFINNIAVPVGNFQVLLTNSLSRMQRLVIVPMLNKEHNGTLKLVPQESLYASEPATCSPNYIRDFNVQLSGSNIYNQNIQYKYENFLNELNGNYGVNSNLETGVCSSLLSMADYNSNYGYIVVDLSRRYDYDEKTPMSVQIQGFVEGTKALDFLCFITHTKEMSIDLNTGAKIE